MRLLALREKQRAANRARTLACRRRRAASSVAVAASATGQAGVARSGDGGDGSGARRQTGEVGFDCVQLCTCVALPTKLIPGMYVFW